MCMSFRLMINKNLQWRTYIFLNPETQNVTLSKTHPTCRAADLNQNLNAFVALLSSISEKVAYHNLEEMWCVQKKKKQKQNKTSLCVT